MVGGRSQRWSRNIPGIDLIIFDYNIKIFSFFTPRECNGKGNFETLIVKTSLIYFLQGAQCADGRALADVDPVLLEIECPDY